MLLHKTKISVARSSKPSRHDLSTGLRGSHAGLSYSEEESCKDSGGPGYLVAPTHQEEKGAIPDKTLSVSFAEEPEVRGGSVWIIPNDAD